MLTPDVLARVLQALQAPATVPPPTSYTVTVAPSPVPVPWHCNNAMANG